jgi:hypothetical protein
MQDKNGKVIAYSAYNPNTGNNILMKPEELSTFKASVENNLGYNIENTVLNTFRRSTPSIYLFNFINTSGSLASSLRRSPKRNTT